MCVNENINRDESTYPPGTFRLYIFLKITNDCSMVYDAAVNETQVGTMHGVKKYDLKINNNRTITPLWYRTVPQWSYVTTACALR